jgi:hypothetical protein
VGTVGLIVIVLAVVVVVGGVAFAVTRRKRPDAAATPQPSVAPAAPMMGLESALDQVMDRSGRKMRENLEAEAAIVDDLKTPDDTGPILRRALDRVERPAEQPPTAS